MYRAAEGTEVAVRLPEASEATSTEVPKPVTPVPPRATARVPVVSAIAIPRDEVASCCQLPPAYEPRSTPAALGEEIPVPPPPAVRVPYWLGGKGRVSPAPA